MKLQAVIICLSVVLLSCGEKKTGNIAQKSTLPLEGTWQLLTATLIEKGDTTRTDYTKGISFIKIINATHFSFLQHDLNKGKDTAVFVAGGGRYTLTDSVYSENLEYCSAREWEGNKFDFSISIEGDTLVQKGIEKVESAGVNRLNIEKYIRVKNQGN